MSSKNSRVRNALKMKKAEKRNAREERRNDGQQSYEPIEAHVVGYGNDNIVKVAACTIHRRGTIIAFKMLEIDGSKTPKEASDAIKEFARKNGAQRLMFKKELIPMISEWCDGSIQSYVRFITEAVLFQSAA